MARTAKKKEMFTCFQPHAARVELVGDFTGWRESPIELKKQKDGMWKTTVPLDPGPTNIASSWTASGATIPIARSSRPTLLAIATACASWNSMHRWGIFLHER